MSSVSQTIDRFFLSAVPVAPLNATYPPVETYMQPYFASDYSAPYDHNIVSHGYEYASVGGSMVDSYGVGPSAQYLYAH